MDEIHTFVINGNPTEVRVENGLNCFTAFAGGHHTCGESPEDLVNLLRWKSHIVKREGSDDSGEIVIYRVVAENEGFWAYPRRSMAENSLGSWKTEFPNLTGWDIKEVRVPREVFENQKNSLCHTYLAP